jgi:hypothetical protein
VSHFDIKQTSQRYGCIIFEIDLDINDPSLEAEFASNPLSYGTPKTTNDFRAYKEGEFRTYRISNQAISNLDCFPALTGANTVPPKANPGIDIGFRASATINCVDFVSSDAFELQGLYADRRVTGSFYAKLFARNFIKNRPARIKRGYLVDGVYDEANFLTEHYIVDEYQGPDLSGRVSFNLVDVLALTNGINAKAPETSNATLAGALTTSSTAATINLESGLSELEIEERFGANGESGVLAIGSEYIQYTVTSATGVNPVVVDLTQRADFGTVLAGHAINSTVQKCVAWPELTNIIDIIDELFRDYTDIDQSYIPAAEWAALKAGELSGFMLTNCIAKETEIKKLLNELIQIAGLTMYVDVIERKIKIVSTPNFDNPVITFDEDEHFEAGTFKSANKFDRVTTRQLVSWAPRDYSKTEQQNYDKTFRVAAILEEQAGRLGIKSAGKDVVSRWLPNTPNGNQIATGIAQREVSRFSQIPTEVSFTVDSKYVAELTSGRFWVGSVFNVRTIRNVYSTAGFQRETLTCQCTSMAADNSRMDKWRVTGISYKANIPPNADYTIPAGEYFNYILADEFDFSEEREYIVVISSGAIFGSTSTSWAAFRQGAFASGATLRLINQGQQIGKGGNGGNGGSVDATGACLDSVGTNGLNGGAAFDFTTDVIIDNSFGLIAGAGGGGAGLPGQCPEAVTGNGGGGGQGFVGGSGGSAGLDLGGATLGLQGPDGSINSSGGDGVTFTRGGGLGEDGQSALSGQSGGSAGAAVITNGNTITITGGNNSEQVRGAIV